MDTGNIPKTKESNKNSDKNDEVFRKGLLEIEEYEFQNNLELDDEKNKETKSKEQINESKAIFKEAQKSYQVDNKIDDFISNFVTNQDKAAKQKKTLKTVFFIVTMIIFGIIVLMPFVTLVILLCLKIDEPSVIIGAMFVGAAEVLTTVIILPKIVAEYLFNKEEEKSNIEIVKLMQKYSETMHGYEDKNTENK